MNKKLTLFSIALFSILLLSIVSAEHLGTFNQNQDIKLKVTCNNCTYCNFTSIEYPNGTEIFKDLVTTMTDTEFSYILTANYTLVIGQDYSYYYNCGNTAEKSTGRNTFDFTPSGKSGTSNIVFQICIISIVLLISLIGFFMKNETMTLLGSMGMISLGLYLIINGILIYQDWFTNLISYILIGLGAYFSYEAGYSLYQNL